MLHRVRYRQPAQIALMVPFTIIALIGIMGLVIDVGVFRLIDSELENAADAAALAAAWYDPVCPGSDPADVSDRSDPAAADPRCPLGDTAEHAFAVAQQFGADNLGLATALCGSTPVIDQPLVHPIQSPNARAVTVIVHCRAGYLAGRILGLGSTEITRWATAGLGEEQDFTEPDGTIRRNLGAYAAYPGLSNPPAPLIARLVPL